MIPNFKDLDPNFVPSAIIDPEKELNKKIQPENFSYFMEPQNGFIWSRNPNFDDFFSMKQNSISISQTQKFSFVQQNPFSLAPETLTLKLDWSEFDNVEDISAPNALTRAPTSHKDFVRGTGSNHPFEFGGFSEDSSFFQKEILTESQRNAKNIELKQKQQKLSEISDSILDSLFSDEEKEDEKYESLESVQNAVDLLKILEKKEKDEEKKAREAQKAEEKRAAPDLEEANDKKIKKFVAGGKVLLEKEFPSLFSRDDEDLDEEYNLFREQKSMEQKITQEKKEQLEKSQKEEEEAKKQQKEPEKQEEEPKTQQKPELLDISLDELLEMDTYSYINDQKEKQRLQAQKTSAAKTTSGSQGTEWAHPDVLDVSKFNDLLPNPAISYPFELDEFQKKAVVHLENSESVFVAAHTSAGKTVVAEYAIALAKKHLTRVIYTSPIKTLSNQKFREFQKKFGTTENDVGIITGDVQINPTASCLIMTTEILRSMLYKGADIIRDVEWVIFDEVHYINDKERGVVWEEVIIMLPKHVGLILLSATIPNTIEFADWVGRTKKKPIYVIETLHRPVPLEHSLFYDGKFYKIVDSSKNFVSPNYRNALAVERSKQAKEMKSAVSKSSSKFAYSNAGGQEKKGGGSFAPKMQQQIEQSQREILSFERRKKQEKEKEESITFSALPKTEKMDWIRCIEQLKKKNLLPTVVFSFSRKKCEDLAYGLQGTVELVEEREIKHKIKAFIHKSVSRLSGSDRNLPQVVSVGTILESGIGIHHSGLLPIVKEMVEILFSKGYVKILFATETFAMGVNMPAKCVIFNGIRKSDGTQFRELLSGEYIQMSGRAGRRGLDKRGSVVIKCAPEQGLFMNGSCIPDEPLLQKMILGKATKLESKFRLTYNMILNLMRVEGFGVEDMLKRSFSEAGNQKYLPDITILKKKKKEIYEDIEDLECIVEDGNKKPEEGDGKQVLPFMQDYHHLATRLSSLQEVLLFYTVKYHCENKSFKKLFNSGRVIVIRTKAFGITLAVLLKTEISSNVSSTSGGDINSFIKSFTQQQDNLSSGSQDDYSSFSSAAAFSSVYNQLKSTLKITCFALPKTLRDSKIVYPSENGLPPFSPMFFSSSSDSSSIDVFLNDVVSISSETIEELASGGGAATEKPAVGGIFGAKKKPMFGPQATAKSTPSNSSSSQHREKLINLWRSNENKGPTSIDVMELYSKSKNQDLKMILSVKQKREVLSELNSHSPCANCLKMREHFLAIDRYHKITDKIDKIIFALSEQNLELMPEFNNRLKVLRKLKYLGEKEDTVQLKGRVACELNSCDELIVTEMIFNNFFNNLSPGEIVAILSCVIAHQSASSKQEKQKKEKSWDRTSSNRSAAEEMLSSAVNASTNTSDSELQIKTLFSQLIEDEIEAILPENLKVSQRELIRLTFGLGKLQSDYGVTESGGEEVADISFASRTGVSNSLFSGSSDPSTASSAMSPIEWVKKKLNFSMLEVAYEWAMGTPFADICKITEISEGNIVRSIIQLDQSCREVRNAARVVGNSALYKKMEECSAMIKRDIVFTTSLYL